MDQFTPGQIVRMQHSWEDYRHAPGYSESFTLAADGIKYVVYTATPTTSKPKTSIEETHNEKSNSKNQKANKMMKLTLNHTTIKMTAGE